MDKIFITVSIFLLVYAWLNFFIRDLWTTFVLSLIFTFACVFLLFYILNKKQEKKLVSKKYLTDVEQNFLAFRVASKTDKLELLKNILSKQYKTEIKNEHILFEKDGEKHQIIIATNIEKLSQFELVNLLQNLEKEVKVLHLICCDTQPNLDTKFLKDLEIEIVTKKKLYDEYFLPHNIFPNSSNLNTKKEKIKLKILLKNFFVPRKAKSYFLCGLVLIFSSIILPFHTYYLIFGSVLIIFSIICKLQPFFSH